MLSKSFIFSATNLQCVYRNFSLNGQIVSSCLALFFVQKAFAGNHWCGPLSCCKFTYQIDITHGPDCIRWRFETRPVIIMSGCFIMVAPERPSQACCFSRVVVRLHGDAHPLVKHRTVVDVKTSSLLHLMPTVALFKEH